MMRSLFSGVSGLKNHQIRMDVIGNNIANINTIGFKKGRVTFEEALAQTMRGAMRPSELHGGTNPMQVGLGITIGSIDTMFSQGNLESTGIQTDLAIQGDGFFVLSDGVSEYYTRSGNFQFDAQGRLINPTNGYVVQGYMANNSGVIEPGTSIGDIVLPFGQKVAAKATTKVAFTGNLNASENPQGTIVRSDVMYAIETTTDDSDVNGLYASGNTNSNITGLIPGITTITVNDGTNTHTYTYVLEDSGASNDDFNSLADLIDEIKNDFSGSIQVTLNSSGALEFSYAGTGTGSATISITSNNAVLESALTKANGTVNSGNTTTTDEFSHRATENDLLINLRNSSGQSLNLSDGDALTISCLKNGALITGNFTVSDDSSMDGSIWTLADLNTQIASVLGLSETTQVSIDSSGRLNIQGDPGADNELSAISISESNNSVLGSTMSFTEIQEAKDAKYSTNVTIYDALGHKHTLTLTFKKTVIPGQWTWEAQLGGDETISAGGQGKLAFNPDGSLLSFTYDGGATALQFNPNNGADPMNVILDVGTTSSYDGLTQFSAPSAVVINSQDGYASGNLSSISIAQNGEITGLFTNGVTKTLAQIVLAVFNNPSGLLKVGDNMFSTSANSGAPAKGAVGEVIQSTILPGSLEMSNVDLAEEFTDMIVAQRGFQANARVITTSDDMLNELVNLKR